MNETGDSTGYGELVTIDDQWQVRFVRHLAHPPEKVWWAITEPEHLEAWFPTTIEGERSAGATLRFSFPRNQAPAFDGTMVTYDPPKLMELLWGPDLLRFELRATANGTELILSDLIDVDEQGKAARDAAGWHACLDILEHHISATTPPWDPDDRWSQVSPYYREHFPAEASSIGPPSA